MNIEILSGPGSAAAKVTLKPGEQLTAEGGSMIAMSGGLSLETSTRQKSGGGVLKALTRGLSGESFFLNHYSAGAEGGEVYLASPLVGDMLTLELKNQNLIVQAGSFVASDPGLRMDFNWQGFKSLLSGESMFWLNISGAGQLILNSFGCVYSVDVDGDYIVDTGHIVAFEETLNFTLSKAGGSWISSVLGGEGIVCRFKGRGRVWCQSHQPQGFGRELGPLLPPR